MRKHLHALLTLTLLACAAAALARTGQEASGGAQASHVMVTPDQMKWGPAPPALPAGAQLAVIEGDPSKAGAFTIRLKFPDGYKVSPHTHPADEKVTVLQGTMGMGLGEKFDAAAGHEMPAGSFAVMPTGVKHYAWAKGETVIQVSSTGPFQINYVNPADDPRKAAQ